MYSLADIIDYTNSYTKSLLNDASVPDNLVKLTYLNLIGEAKKLRYIDDTIRKNDKFIEFITDHIKLREYLLNVGYSIDTIIKMRLSEALYSGLVRSKVLYIDNNDQPHLYNPNIIPYVIKDEDEALMYVEQARSYQMEKRDKIMNNRLNLLGDEDLLKDFFFKHIDYYDVSLCVDDRQNMLVVKNNYLSSKYNTSVIINDKGKFFQYSDGTYEELDENKIINIEDLIEIIKSNEDINNKIDTMVEYIVLKTIANMDMYMDECY